MFFCINLHFVIVFCLCYKYAKAFDTFEFTEYLFTLSATLIVRKKNYCMQKMIA